MINFIKVCKGIFFLIVRKFHGGHMCTDFNKIMKEFSENTE